MPTNPPTPSYVPAPRLTAAEYLEVVAQAAAYAERLDAEGVPVIDWRERTERPEADRYEEQEAARFGGPGGHEA